MNKTGIRWTGRTWNPASGCEVVSEECKFCYAETLAEKYRGTPAFKNGFQLTLRPHKLKEPLNLLTPTLIFVNSMSDLFWEQIADDYRDRVLEVIEATPQHQYQVLTKRPEEMLRYSKRRPLPPNFWAGVSIGTDRWCKRADILRAVEARIRFLSLEPLLSPLPSLDLTAIDWVITGGESGLHLRDEALCERRGLVRYQNGRWIPREDRLDWVRAIRDHCIEKQVAFFHKQWGGAVPTSAGHLLDGKDWSEYPMALSGTQWKRRTHEADNRAALGRGFHPR